MNCRIDELKVKELITEYGSPLYIFHAEEFEDNYLSLLKSIRKIYPKYDIAYSYKTNYTPMICKQVKELGGLAEVVSEMEYDLAKKIGYTNDKIVYNGPVKGEGLFDHLMHGGVANIDNLDEMQSVVEFAKRNSKMNIRIAFRVNIDIDQGFISRFGIDAYEDVDKDKNSEIDKAFTMIDKQENISVVGIHCHVGKSRNIDAWKNRIRIMFKLIDRYFKITPEFIDLGSGMNSVMEPELACQFGGHIPTFNEYADVVATAMNEKYGHLPFNSQPWLYTEPGTTLISGCMSFLGTVKSIKNVKKKTYVTFDCSGGNMGDICHLKNLPISIYHNGGELNKISDGTFVGYTCLEHDHMYDGFNGELAVGDIIQFRNIGSYSNVFKPPFILPNCAMVQITKEGDVELIKHKETFDDIFHTYVF
ncbi:MAG: hypothetical protein ACI4FZ_08320 [Lachnospiraceae bacterium]